MSQRRAGGPGDERTEHVSQVNTLVGPTESLLEELAEVDTRFEHAPPSKVLEWAVERFGDSLGVAASFQDLVLIDLAVDADPNIEIIFLDTEAHFPETLDFVDEAVRRYELNLTVTKPGPEAAAVPCGADGCCALRKVAPLRRSLEGKDAWITGLKRVDATTRTEAPIVSWDDQFGLVKINPLATWTEDDVDCYVRDYGLPSHPLRSQGYVSIGCAPTTRPTGSDEDPRSGRWSGSGKIECGLHG
jgi:phosphoadenosine phosphosulfate reductase